MRWQPFAEDGSRVREVVAVFIVDVALEHTCAEFRLRAADGQVTAAERDLLIDGALLLANKIEELLQDARAGVSPGSPDPAHPSIAIVAGPVLAGARHG